MAEAIDLTARIAAESAALSPDKQNTVLDFILFVKERAGLVDAGKGDADWERIIERTTPYPRLDAFLHAAAQEGEEPLDPARL